MSDDRSHFPPPNVAPIAAIPISDSATVLSRQRPGMITAIGVLSIIVACLTCMTSFLSGCESVLFSKMSNGFRQMAPGARAGHATVLPFGAQAPTPDLAKNTGDNGLLPADLAAATSVVMELEPTLSAARSKQLNNILAESGKSIFPTGGEALTPQRVKTSITVHRVVAGSGEDDPGYTLLMTNWGELKLFDDKAVFTPSDSSPTIESSAPGAENGAGDNSSPPSAQPASAPVLSAHQIKQVVAKVQKAALNKLSPVQIASLTKALEDPSQTFVTRNTTISPVTFVNMLPDGNAWIYFQGGVLQIDPQGQTNGNPFGNAMKNMKIDAAPCQVALIASILSVGLAIYLFIAGIMVFQQSPAGGKLHRIYAWIKIPLAIIGTAAIAKMNFQFYRGITGFMPGAPNPLPTMVTIFWVSVGVIALIYPIGLLFALRSKTVRSFYNAVRA